MAPFRSRAFAGRELADALHAHCDPSTLVLGVPRGGVTTAAPIARALGAPLDAWISRKIPAPRHPRVALGAVAEGGEIFVDRQIVRWLGVSEEELDLRVMRAMDEVAEYGRWLRGHGELPRVAERAVILVDDGIASGATVRAACRALRREDVKRLVVAVPIASTAALASLRHEADELLCLEAREDLGEVASWYEEPSSPADDEVRAALQDNGSSGAIT